MMRLLVSLTVLLDFAVILTAFGWGVWKLADLIEARR